MRNFKYRIQNAPLKIICLALFYALVSTGVFGYMIYDLVSSGGRMFLLYIYGAFALLCLAETYFFLCGEKLACSFMLGLSAFGFIFCMQSLLAGGAIVYLAGCLLFLASGIVTFFSGMYFVAGGIGKANMVQSTFIVLASGLGLIPFFQFMISGLGIGEALLCAVCAVFYCLHTKIGLYSMMGFGAVSVFVYGITAFLIWDIYAFFVMAAYVAILIITVRMKRYLCLNIRT